MIKFHEPYRSKNTEKYLQEVVQRNSFNDSYFTEKCIEHLSEFYQTTNLLLTHSGTASLEMSAMLLKKNIGKMFDDTIIKIPSYTFSSTANAFLRSEFRTKFVDIDEKDMIVSSDELINLGINEYLVSVNYANSTFNYPDKNLEYLIEDSAQSYGVKFDNKPVGTFGKYGCVSFHPTKNLHAGYGGLLIVKNDEEFEIAKTIWERGTDRNKVISGQKSKYEWVSLGSSFQITELSAAVLLSQLEVETEITQIRKEIYETYENLININELSQHVSIQKVNHKVSPNYHAFYILLNDSRDKFIEFMYKNGIQTFIGYENLHQSSFGVKNNLNFELKVTEDLSQKLVRLPMHTNLLKSDIVFICEKIQEYFQLN